MITHAYDVGQPSQNVFASCRERDGAVSRHDAVGKIDGQFIKILDFVTKSVPVAFTAKVNVGNARELEKLCRNNREVL